MGKSKYQLESERINRNPQDKLESAYSSLHLNLNHMVTYIQNWHIYPLSHMCALPRSQRNLEYLVRAEVAANSAAAGHHQLPRV